MSSTRRNLRLAAAFGTLLIFAAGVGCKGFFVNPTVSTITIDPPTPTVGFGPGSSPVQLTAAATFSDGSTGTLTGGTSCTGTTVCWSSSDPSVATLSTGGLLTGISVGTTTITAASGSVTGTTTATVAESVSSMTITPPSASVPADGASTATYTIMGQTQSGSQNISSLVTLTASSAGTAATTITCTPETDNQTCIADTGTTPATYTITVTYGGYTGTAAVTASLVVSAPPS